MTPRSAARAASRSPSRRSRVARRASTRRQAGRGPDGGAAARARARGRGRRPALPAAQPGHDALPRGHREDVERVERPDRLQRRTRGLRAPWATRSPAAGARLGAAARTTRGRMRPFFERHDVLLTPDERGAARQGRPVGGARRRAHAARDGPGLSVRGALEPHGPAGVAVPAGTSEDGLPIGVHARGPPRRGGHPARRSPPSSRPSCAGRTVGRLSLSSLPRVRQLRIHDTLSGEVVPVEPSDGGRVGIYACGPTVYGRLHVGTRVRTSSSRCSSASSSTRATTRRSSINVTDVNDKIYDAARERGVPSEELAREMTAAYVEDTDRLGLGRPDEEPKATRDDRGDRRADRRPRRLRPRLRARRRRLLPRRLLRRLRQALEPPARGDAAGRGRRRRRAEGVAAGLRALEGAQGGRGHLVGVALGRGQAGLAHRVLGDGRGGAGRALRGARRRLRPRLPAPRERDRSDRGGARQAARTYWMHNGMVADGRREDGEVGRQHPAAPRRARRVRSRRLRHVDGRRALPEAGRVHRGRARGRRQGGGSRA